MTIQGEELEKALLHDEARKEVHFPLSAPVTVPGPYSDAKPVVMSQRMVLDAVEKLSALLIAKCMEAVSQATPDTLETAISNVEKMLSLYKSLKNA